ncbi:hypothetical protein J6590_013282 [Homalodisca vitripennis]|nr:hypothetical protein J6590_013282 [Homalodisca vitripennis]
MTLDSCAASRGLASAESLRPRPDWGSAPGLELPERVQADRDGWDPDLCPLDHISPQSGPETVLFLSSAVY